jgi:myo-inositol-1(or 4)-monophosphatase
MLLKKICQQACAAAHETGKYILQELHSFDTTLVEEKSMNQLVSYVDRNAEEMLINHLGKLLPDAGFIAEENTIVRNDKEWMWVIDPLDGTTNFVHRIPVFSISIGLLRNHQPVCGVVYEINRDEMFYASLNNGAFLNNKKITVKQNTLLSRSLLATGFPYYDFDRMDAYLQTLHTLLKETQGMRRMGSAAVDLAYVACGRFDGFFEYGLSPWDVAGGACLVSEAGGKITDFSGSDNYLFGKEIIAASVAIMPALSGVIKSRFC